MEPGSAGELETRGHWSPLGPGLVSVPLEVALCPFSALTLFSEGALCWNKEPKESHVPKRAEGWP